MRHLTFTGKHAGQSYCGIKREDAAKKGESFCHLPYDPTERFRETVCPDCKKLYDEVAGEPDSFVS